MTSSNDSPRANLAEKNSQVGKKILVFSSVVIILYLLARSYRFYLDGNISLSKQDVVLPLYFLWVFFALKYFNIENVFSYSHWGYLWRSIIVIFMGIYLSGMAIPIFLHGLGIGDFISYIINMLLLFLLAPLFVILFFSKNKITKLLKVFAIR